METHIPSYEDTARAVELVKRALLAHYGRVQARSVEIVTTLDVLDALLVAVRERQDEKRGAGT